MMYNQRRRGWFTDFIVIAGPIVTLALLALYLFVRWAA